MKIKQKEVSGIAVLEVSGEMYGGPENMKLVETVQKLAADGVLNCVVDCAKVKWISSTGLGILVTARNKYAKEGGVLRLCRLNDRVVTLFQVTKMALIFEVFETEDEAIAAFSN